MIYKISVYFFLPMLFLALFLSMAGVRQITFGDDYYIFMSNVVTSFNKWKMTIPNIPSIPEIAKSTFNSSGGIIDVLIKIGNFFVVIFNGFIGIINVGILVANIFVQLIQFVVTIIYQCKDFITKVSPSVV